MRLLISIATSLICGTALAAVFYRYVAEHAAAPGFWQTDAFATLWAAFGGAGGLMVLGYALFAFAIVTSYAYLDLNLARTRLLRRISDTDQAPERQWRAAFADTDFKALAEQITPYELGGAPLSLLRLLRGELWRIYLRRMIGVTAIAVALLAAVVALAPGALEAPLSAQEMHWRLVALVLAAAAAAAVWIAMDHAIGHLAMTITRIAANWTDAVPPAEPAGERRGAITLALPPPPVAPTSDDLIAVLDRLAKALSPRGRPAGSDGDGAIVPLAAALDAHAARADALIERLMQSFAAHADDLARAVAAARPAEAEIAAMSAALTALAASVDKLADPVLRRMQLLGATDRRLLAVLQRQEQTVGSVTTRWSELVAAVRAMGAGLESFADVAQRHADADADIAPAPARQSAALGDELQDLLDEISATASGAAARPKP